MQRNAVLKVLNPVLALLVLNQLLTGFLRGVLPRRAFETLHEGGGMVVAAAVVLHILLNWNWVKANLLRHRPAAGP